MPLIDIAASTSTLPAKYTRGVMRTITNRRYDDDPDTVSLAQVLQTGSKTTRAVVLTYGFDEHWLLPQFDKDTARASHPRANTSYVLLKAVVIVSHPRKGAHKNERYKEQGHSYGFKNYPNARHFVPPFQHANGGKGCSHAKLLILYGSDGWTRFVVSTANFKYFEWSCVESECLHVTEMA